MSLLHPLCEKVLIEPTAHFHTGENFLPGAGIEVYEPYFQNPLITLLGAATECGSSPSPFGAPPIYVPAPMGIVIGQRTDLGEFQSTGLSEL